MQFTQSKREKVFSGLGFQWTGETLKGFWTEIPKFHNDGRTKSDGQKLKLVQHCIQRLKLGTLVRYLTQNLN